MTPVDDVLDIILKHVKELFPEKVYILESLGRVIFNDIISNVNIPSLNNSAMDGYALISAETIGAKKNSPLSFKIIEEIQAGGSYQNKKLLPGTAIRIMTGAPIPEGADSVIPVEDTEESGDRVKIFREIKKNENVRFAGEDISIGQKILFKGRIIRSADIGIFSSLNYEFIDVYKMPSVGIISTGDEIIDIGEDIKPGQIRNSNAYTLNSEIKKYRGIPNYLGIAPDTKEGTKQKFIEAMENDIIITTGGVSMGRYDFVPEILKDLGVDIKISKVSMKPGKPFVFGFKGDKLFFGLPGNPVSTMVSFIEFVRPALLRMMGAVTIKKPLINAILKDDLKKKPDERRHFLRGFYSIENGNVYVSTTGPQGSGILRSMHEANCLIIFREGISFLAKGSSVEIELIGHEEI